MAPSRSPPLEARPPGRWASAEEDRASRIFVSRGRRDSPPAAPGSRACAARSTGLGGAPSARSTSASRWKTRALAGLAEANQLERLAESTGRPFSSAIAGGSRRPPALSAARQGGREQETGLPPLSLSLAARFRARDHLVEQGRGLDERTHRLDRRRRRPRRPGARSTSTQRNPGFSPSPGDTRTRSDTACRRAGRSRGRA